MKILILVNLDNYLYNFRKELLQALLEENHSIFASLPAGDYSKKLTEMGCQIIDTALVRRSKNPLKDLRLMRQYSKIVKEIKPDVVLTYTTKPNIYGGIVCRYHKVPYICNITGLGTAVENKGILQKLTIALYKTAMKRAQRVFFQNRENLEFFVKKGVVGQNYMLLPGSGVNITRFAPLPYPPEETIEFVFIGRLMTAKGLDEYFTAAMLIKEKYPNTRFHICGFCEQDYDTKLRHLQEKKIIIYHGMVNDIRNILATVHCTIQPSHHEGMSNTVLESAATARPVIATDIAGCREAVEDEVSGYLFPKRNTDVLVAKIEQFILLQWEQKREMGMAGRRKVEREFDRQIVVDAYMDEIRRCVQINE